MRNEARDTIRRIVFGAVLVVAGLWLAWLCIRIAVVRTMPSSAPILTWVAPNAPDVVLERAAIALVRQRGIVEPATLSAVRRAATMAPLDARPFLILGHQQLLDHRPEQALATLEAGQRLDPRQRVIHLLLLDRYLRTGRFAQAATQFALSARLVGTAGNAISAALAQMSLAPATRNAVRQTLRQDPSLEQSVLGALARSDTAPATVFALASPFALRDAGNGGSWGPVLVARLMQDKRFAEAHAVWQRLYRLSDTQAAAPLFDAKLQKLAGSPPFNWTLANGKLGAADMHNQGLNIEYYGRESGELAGQLLVLRPGAYRFAYTTDGGQAGGSTLAWMLVCGSDSHAILLRSVVGPGARRTSGVNFTVPAGCPVQQLSLNGEAGEFPAPTNVTLRDLDLRAVSEGHP